MDVHTKTQRSFNMSRIKGKDTKPELIVRKIFHALGYRFRLHNKQLPGKPDLVFPKYKSVVFVHGCFWHSHHCRWGQVTPKTNSVFWQNKRSKTVERDRTNIAALESNGWKLHIIWECEINDMEILIERLGSLLKS